MPRHAQPPRIVPLAVADGMLLCAAGLAIYGTHVAAHPTADERFTTAPEASEPVARGGPLLVPSIGALEAASVESSSPEIGDVGARPAATRPPVRPQEPRRTVQGSTGARETVPAPPRDVPAAGIAIPATTTTPNVTATPPETTAAATATTTETTTEAAATETTTAETTATATATTTTSSEPDVGDLLASLIEEATGR